MDLTDLQFDPALDSATSLDSPETPPAPDAAAPLSEFGADLDPRLAAQLASFDDQPFGTEIGVNVAWFSPSEANNLVVFVNQIKGARPWDDASNSGEMTYDENGYPTSVPGHFVASQLLIRSEDLQGIDPHTGTFRLYGQGEGEISLSSTGEGTLVHRADTAALETESIDGTAYWFVDVDFDIAAHEEIGQLKMLIHSLTDGDHIRDLALVHHSHLGAHRAGEMFAPELVEDLQGYATLRFMDWMRANKIDEAGDGWSAEGSDWSSPTPEKRFVTTDNYTYNTASGGKRNEGVHEVSVPIETIVELANQVGADPWINLPVDITDARAAQLASYVAENLDDGLTARWEYGNELFNDGRGFESFRYATARAQETFEDFDLIGSHAAAEWAAYRGPQVYDVIRTELLDEGIAGRFVAPGWSFSGSLRASGELNDGYLVRYFAAEQAQKMADAGPMPLEIVTDYTVAMYFGGTVTDGRPDGAVAHHIVETVEGAQAQAETLADWLLFGSVAETFVELTADHIDAPMTGLDWREGLDIGVTPLIWKDLRAGLDPLRELEEVLRLDGDTLQYRGESAPEWSDVLIFDEAPDKTLSQMIADIDLVGWGSRLHGEIQTGLRSGIAHSADFRLDAHAGYADALGLNFVAYEGGSHVSYPVEGGFGMFDAFNNGTAGAEVFARWLQIMSEKGLEEYMHFMSHSRTNGSDWWGVQDYIGQDVADEPEAIVLRTAMAAYDPDYDVTPDGPLRDAQSVNATETGTLVVDMPVIWSDAGPWSVAADGSATETQGTNDQLRLAERVPLAPGETYEFRFDVGLEGTEETEIRVVARALGDTREELLRWQGTVSDGETLDFDLGEMTDGMTALDVIVQRVGTDRSGAVTVANANLVPVGLEGKGVAGRGALVVENEVIWEATEHWQLGADGAATEINGSNTQLRPAERLPVTAGERYTLSLAVELDEVPSTELRVIVRARGDGSADLVSWRGLVTDNQSLSFDLGTMPDGMSSLHLVVQRVGSDRSGALTVSDAELAVLDTSEPITPTPLLEGFETALRNDPAGWEGDAGGQVYNSDGSTNPLTLASLLDVRQGVTYGVSFTVGLEGADDAKLRLVGQAKGGGADEVARWQGTVTDGDVVKITLDEIPADRDLLDLILRRVGAEREGTLSLGDFSLTEMAPAP